LAGILSRSVNGVFPDASSSKHHLTGREFEVSYEATISTVENTPQTATRIFEPQLEQERARDFAQPPPGGPETSHAGLKGLGAWLEKRLRG
jgi:hypothetical protein